MITFLIRRLLYSLLIMFLASLVMYFIVVSNPAGGPLNAAWYEVQSIPNFNQKPAEERTRLLEEIKHQLGLDVPTPILYLRWLYDWRPQEDPAQIRTYLATAEAKLNLDSNQLNAQQRQDWEAHQGEYRQQVDQLRDELNTAEAALDNCRNLLDFSKLGACLAIPRYGGILSANLGYGRGGGVTQAIFGRPAGSTFDQFGNEVSAEATYWHSPFANTMFLIFFALILALLFAMPIGIFSAVKQYSIADYGLSLLTFAGMAMPVFWLGAIMLLLNFRLGMAGLPTFPVSGVVDNPSDTAQFGDIGMRLKHLLVPSFVLAFTYMAGFSRFLRASMLEILSLDYVRTAWAKGLKPRAVILKHTLRNALIPLITRVTLALPLMLGSVVLVERIFKYDGMGNLMYNAAFNDNWNLMMGLLIISALFVILSGIIADVLYSVVDPRIRRG